MKVRLDQTCHPWMAKLAYVDGTAAQPSVFLGLAAENCHAFHMHP